MADAVGEPAEDLGDPPAQSRPGRGPGVRERVVVGRPGQGGRLQEPGQGGAPKARLRPPPGPGRQAELRLQGYRFLGTPPGPRACGPRAPAPPCPSPARPSRPSPSACPWASASARRRRPRGADGADS